MRISNANPHHRVIYRIGEWSRDYMLGMIGVDPNDPISQMKYQCLQGRNEYESPSASKGMCVGVSHTS